MTYFFVSRPGSGRREGFEYQRVMYFNPETEESSKQTDLTGVAEAFFSFIDNFRKGNEAPAGEYDHRFVRTKKSLEVFIQVEKKEYIIGIRLDRNACQTAGYFVHLASIKNLVIRTYETFRLFYGTFNFSFAEGRGFLMQKLDQFFSHYLSLLKVHQIPLIDRFSGIAFLNIPSQEFLDVQCFISRCIDQFPMIKRTIFLYQDKMIQYSVVKQDIYVVYRYLTHHLIQSAVFSELKPLQKINESANEFVGKFITGSLEFAGQENSKENDFPAVYLTVPETGEMEWHSVIAYRALNATLCLFVPVEKLSDLNLPTLQETLDYELSRLASDIGENVSSTSKFVSPDILFHYIYFNPDSLSLKTSFTDVSKTPMPPASIYALVCETFDHFIDTNVENFTQVEVKGDENWWVVVKKMNGRLLTLFLPSQSTTTILEIQDVVDQIVETYFSNLFLV
uniref:CCZ1/INTU/HSP4 first Longin domain-containing protein n=1 Tax=Panagrolaimus sp. JU765 TaxID=591449 RepID=A0AC34RSW9_9BILA